MQDFRPAGGYTIQGLAQARTVCNTQIHQINNEKEHTHYLMILGFHTYNEYIHIYIIYMTTVMPQLLQH